VYEGDFSIYDVNSMYPSVMRSFNHPVGQDFTITDGITPDTCFVILRGESSGHLAWHDFQQQISHYTASGAGREFCLTIHELRMALKLGVLKVERILKCFNFPQQSNFSWFVMDFHKKRQAALRRGDKLQARFFKNVLNAASGKFAQNPHNNFAHEVVDDDVELDPPEVVRDCYNCQHDRCFIHWERVFGIEFLQKVIWRKRVESSYVLNVATAASITGAARAMLMRAAVSSKRAMYLDTDAIICEQLGDGEPQHQSDLGAWKREARGNRLALAGAKRYALFADKCPTCGGGLATMTCDDNLFHQGGGCVKMASAGMRVSPQDIEALALRRKSFSEIRAGSKVTLERIGQAVVKRFKLGAGGEVEVSSGLAEQAFRIVESEDE